MGLDRSAPQGRRVIIEADDRGRVSLGRFGIRSMQLVAESTADGGVIIHPAIALTPAEAAHYGDPEAVRLLDEALEASKEGRLKSLTLRSTPHRPD